MLKSTGLFVMGAVCGGITVYTYTQQDVAVQQTVDQLAPVIYQAQQPVVAAVQQEESDKPILSQSEQKVAELEEEIFHLKMEVVKAKQNANDAIAEMRNTQNSRLKQTVKAKVAVNFDDLLETIPEPFATKVYELNGGMAETFMDYYHQEQNSDWAYDLEYKIKDAITMHEQGINVRLESVTCKASICEVRGFQTDVSVWMKIGRDIMSESWWPFVNSNSTNHTDQEYGDYFYVLLSTE